MTARIFISYRSADGTDKATALARELGAVFGDAQVFIDKDDLRGGAVWRREVAQALGAQPVLLLLVTPQLLAAADAAGRLRIADPADPVRRELAAALDAGAHVVPLLADGVDALPDPASLPPPFDRIGERTWRRLRAHDWPQDVRRLADDLRALGVAAHPAAPTPAPAAAIAHPPAGAVAARRRRWLAVAVPAALLTAGGAAWWIGSRRHGAAVGRADGAALAASLSGDWQLSGSGDAPFRLTLRHEAQRIALRSRPFSVAARADWAAYRAFWRERFQAELGDVFYRGDGLVDTPPGEAPVVDMAIQIIETARESPVDSGNLHLFASADGQRLTGRLWLNSVQADRAVELRRLR